MLTRTHRHIQCVCLCFDVYIYKLFYGLKHMLVHASQKHTINSEWHFVLNVVNHTVKQQSETCNIISWLITGFLIYLFLPFNVFLLDHQLSQQIKNHFLCLMKLAVFLMNSYEVKSLEKLCYFCNCRFLSLVCVLFFEPLVLPHSQFGCLMCDCWCSWGTLKWLNVLPAVAGGADRVSTDVAWRD